MIFPDETPSPTTRLIVETLTREVELEPMTACLGAGSSFTTATARRDTSTPAVSDLINPTDSRWKQKWRGRVCLNI
ncbi:hypothetical protein CHARACLAT_010715 [Characodon lateralis]|uniref:Uncharacterized protein n=1 Tax=Characodon lateralis TaxID=208331 RepID=A0ABU7DU14_9TELE|nr:hypothetical protein [Characodon lateralis]